MCEIMNSAKKRWQSEAWAEERKKARKQLETTMRNLHEDGMSIEKIARMTSQPFSQVEAFFQK